MIAVTSIVPMSSWRDHAACRGVDPSIFHPDDEEEDELAGQEAKAVCFQCPVREACLEHAIAVREKHGIWGGLTSRERRRLIRRRRRAS
ncbi:MAG: WhiB family transcriptional regulator [Acidimicrobiia bacterium]